jgi:rod shape-determining protein MreD
MISSFFKWVGLFVLLFILQTTTVPIISIYGIKPDLLILILCIFAFRTDVVPALTVGFFLGLTQDFYSPEILGQNALAKTVTGFFAGLFNERVMRIDPVFQMTLILLAFLLHDLIYIGVQIFKMDVSLQHLGYEIVTSTLPRAFYTLFFALIPTFREYFFPAGKR